MKKNLFVLSFLAAVSVCTYAFAEMTVVSVKGEFAALKGGAWVPLAAGAKIAEGTKVCTGTGSNAVIRIDDHTLALGPVTSIKLYRNTSTASSSDTSVGLQFGTVRAKIKRTATVKTRFNITTPVATSSVRGTEEIVSYGAYKGMRVEVIEGAVGAYNDYGVSNRVSGRASFSLGARSSRPDSVNAQLRSVATVSVTPSGVTKPERDAVDRTGGEDLVVNEGANPATGTARADVRFVWK